MGSSDSRHQITTDHNGHLYIQINQIEFNAGDIIDGVVHLQLNEKFLAKSLELEIYGAEKIYWKTESSDGGKTDTTIHKGKLLFLSSKQNLFSFPGSEALPGQYSFPFTYQLPLKLPSSVLYYGYKHAKISQRYKVIARMQEAGYTSNQSYKPFLAKRRFNLIGTPDVVPELNKSLTMDKAIKTFFFVKQGTSKATVTFDKNVYKSNDVARVKFDIDNRSCDKDLTKIKLQFIRTINAKDSIGRTYGNFEMLQVAKCKGVKAGEQKEIFLELNLIENQKNFFMDWSVQQKQKPLIPEDIALTQHLTPSLTGQMFKVQYFFQVKFSHKGMTLGSKIPPAKYQIHINAQHLRLQPQNIDAPIGWNPQNYQNQQLVPQIEFPIQGIGYQQYAMGIPIDKNQMTQEYPTPFYEGSQSKIDQPATMSIQGTQFNNEQAIRERALKKQLELEESHTIDQDQTQISQQFSDHLQNPQSNMNYSTTDQGNQFDNKNNLKMNGQQDQQQEDITQLYPSLEISSNSKNPQDKQ
eukprot:403350027